MGPENRKYQTFAGNIGEIGSGPGKIGNIGEIGYWIGNIGEIGTGIQNGSKQSGVRWIGNIGKKIGKIGIADKSGLLDKYGTFQVLFFYFGMLKYLKTRLYATQLKCFRS